MAVPMKKCSHPQCRELIATTETYCAKHRRERHRVYDEWRERENPKYSRFYGKALWQKTRRQALLRDDFMCVHCLKQGMYKEAELVDHIVPVREDWSKRLDVDNLQSLCNSCHAIKTEEDRRNYGNSTRSN